METMDELVQQAQEMIHQLVNGDFAAVCKYFDSKMAQAMPQDKLGETWRQLTSQVGPFQKILASQASERGENRLITVTCQFEKSPMDIHVVFNQGGQINGLNVTIAPSTSPYKPPAYVNSAAFQDIEVTVGSGEWALPATLSMPEGVGPFPGVVLVHGSGPNDRDQTIGPNKIFRDLAWGLASQGIAVLRYDKRTKAHAAKFTPELLAKMTVQEEVIDDALIRSPTSARFAWDRSRKRVRAGKQPGSHAGTPHRPARPGHRRFDPLGWPDALLRGHHPRPVHLYLQPLRLDECFPES